MAVCQAILGVVYVSAFLYNKSIMQKKMRRIYGCGSKIVLYRH